MSIDTAPLMSDPVVLKFWPEDSIAIRQLPGVNDGRVLGAEGRLVRSPTG